MKQPLPRTFGNLPRLGAQIAENMRRTYELVRKRRPHVGPIRPPLPLADKPLLAFACVLIAVAAAILIVDAPSPLLREFLPDEVRVLFNNITRIGKSDWMLWSTGLTVIAIVCFAPEAACFTERSARFTLAGLSAYLFSVVAVSGITVLLLKALIGRNRPRLRESEGFLAFHPLSLDNSHHSFPSGHATSLAALAIGLCLLFPRWRIAIAVLAALIALSRVSVGAHYPADVIAGLALGTFTAAGMAVFFARKRFVFKVKSNGTLWPRIRPGRLPRILQRGVTAAWRRWRAILLRGK